jgi:hypothetical protein
MKQNLLKSSIAALFVLLFSTVSFADIRIKKKQDIAGRTITSEVAIKGPRERSESEIMPGMKSITIRECDLKRNITINESARKYLIEPMVSGADNSGRSPIDVSAASGPPESRKGGIVTVTSVSTDTGERKQMFGFNARHIKTSVTFDSSPEACQQQKMKIETDGWYINLNVEFSCESDYAPPMGMPNRRSGCQDQMRFKRSGIDKRGYPLIETMRMFDADGSESFSTTSEVIELTQSTLDPALFEIPAGFTQASSHQEMYSASSLAGAVMGAGRNNSQSGGEVSGGVSSAAAAAAADAKKPGTIRVGVVGLENRTSESFDGESLRQRLIGGIKGGNIDAVAIYSKAPSDVTSEAKQKGCDFVLYTDVTDLKQSSANKMGGLLGRAAGVGGMVKQRFESTIDFRLLATGSETPQLQSKSNAKEDGDSNVAIGSAIDREAKMVSSAAKKR